MHESASLIRELLPEVTDNIRQAAVDGKLVVFFGSGVSVEAGYPDWPGLIQRFQAALKTRPAIRTDLVLGMDLLLPDRGLDVLDVWMKLDLPKVKQIYRSIFPKDRTQYPPTEFGRRLAGLNCAKFLTPNYDFCFQSSARSIGLMDLKEMTLKNIDARNYQDSRFPLLCQIHGSAEETIEDLVLTRSQYNHHYQQLTNLSDFLNQVFSNNAVLFAGFGPNDEYVNSLLNQTNAYTPSLDGLARVAIYGCRPGQENVAKANALALLASQLWNINVLHYQIHLDGQEEDHHEALDVVGYLEAIVGVRTALPASSAVADTIDTNDALRI